MSNPYLKLNFDGLKGKEIQILFPKKYSTYEGIESIGDVKIENRSLRVDSQALKDDGFDMSVWIDGSYFDCHFTVMGSENETTEIRVIDKGEWICD